MIDRLDCVTEHCEERLIHELFERQALVHPQATAAVCDGESLTYADLNARANRVAWYLRDRGIGPDQLVAICVERSLEMVIGLLGILKAGGAYVPLDPSYPRDRLAHMLEDAEPKIVLTQGRLLRTLPASRASVITLDSGWREISKYGCDNLLPEVLGLRPWHLAYVIYTSGSTGLPKGAMNEHRAVVNRIVWMQKQYQLGSHDRVLQKTPFSFDVSVWEFFWTLMSGARLIMARPDGHRNPAYLRDLIEKTGVTTLHFVPSMLEVFLQQPLAGRCPSLQHIVCSGEELSPSLQNRSLALLPQARLSNLYGPTECAVDVTAWECVADPDCRRVPIGRAITNAQIYILDDQGAPTRVGEAGEIFIGGVAVGRGYWNRPELTAERFVRDPFSSYPQARMYRTGDMGCWRPDGAIEYLGRNDFQVKIRGFRIELGEIEAQLAAIPGIAASVVIAREDEPGEKRLVAYVVVHDPSLAPSCDGLRQHLKAVLPDYMVPSAFVVMDGFPLTPNGKLDRRALPAPDLSSCTSQKYEAPRGELEETLVRIWRELLRVERVGRNDNFFGLGGHSLLIVHLMERLRRLGLTVEAQSVYERPTVADLATVLTQYAGAGIEVPPNLVPPRSERITPEMLPLVDLEQEHIDRIAQTVPGGAANIQDVYPLVPLQHGMLFHHLFDSNAGDAYVISTLLSLSSRGALNELIAALQWAVNRHDILRTAVLWENLPQPVQVVYRRAEVSLEQMTLDRGRDLVEQMKEEMLPGRQRLEIRKAPLIHLKLANDPDTNRWYAVLQIHHLACDEQSFGTLLTELRTHLERCADKLPQPVAYRNHVAQALTLARTRRAKDYFRRKLGDVDAATAPFGFLEVRGDGSQIREGQKSLGVDLAERVRAEARKLGVSPAAVFHAAWALVVSLTTGREDVVFGTVLLGRMLGSTGGEGGLGVFINTLPLRINLDLISAKLLVGQVHRELMELLAYEQASLADAQRASGLPESVPLFTSLLNYRHSAGISEKGWSSMRGIEILGTTQRTNYPITVSVDDLRDGFRLTGHTDEAIEPKRILAYLSRALESLVEALECFQDTSALSLEVMPDEERLEVLEGFNDTRTEYPRSALIHELFEEQVVRSPTSVAVTSEGVSLTYSEVAHKADQLATLLRAHGVCAGDYIPIMMPRSLSMLIAQIAVLKCGGAYVPLDPETPSQRLRFIMNDCGARCVLSEGRGRPEWIPESIEWIDCAARDHVIKRGDGRTPSTVNSMSPAYVMYTSGSTGAPKGVIVSHRSVIRLVINCTYLEIGPTDCIPHCSNPAFDASTFEIWGALLNGARVLVVPQSVVLDAPGLAKILIEERATIVWMTLGLLKQYQELLAKSFSGLRYLITGGEVVDLDIAARVLRCDAPQHFLNAYGPTECTTFSTTHVIEAGKDAKCIPIGRPISNSTLYILDKKRRLLPVGAVGEIYVGGDGVGIGYLSRPDLTAERFLADPFSAEPGARMYRTGDLGRWRPDGTVDYLGRNDDQVKIRGFRIELGEIEAQLMRCAGVKEAVVAVREDAPGKKHLVGYVIPLAQGVELSAESLRQRLKTTLPEYMVPSAFVRLEAFPLTANGKLDRRALPAPTLEDFVHAPYDCPRGEIEEVLAGIWERVLSAERIGRNDHFFELGGHSLSATQMVLRVQDALSICVSVRDVFEHPTLSRFSVRVDEIREEQRRVEPLGDGKRFEALLQRVASMSDGEVQEWIRELKTGVRQ